MPYYQSLPPYPPLYPAPVPFYTTYPPAYMYHSLPTPAPTGLYPPNQWLQTLPPVPPPPPLLLTPSLSQSQESRVPVAASCTQTDLTFVESPMYDQVMDFIYSQVRSLVSENKTRPFYLIGLVRAALLLNTDYLRQTCLDSLELLINNCPNTDRQEAEAFSALVPTEQGSPAGEGTAAEEGVYSPTQNLPLARHYLDTNISGSSGNAASESCVPRGHCHLPDPAGHQRGYSGQEGGRDISEMTTSELYVGVSPWEQQMRVLMTRLLPLLKEHSDRTCEPRLLELIHCEAMFLLSELFPEEVALPVRGLLDSDLKEVLSRYTSQLLRHCRDEMLLDVHDLFLSQLDPLTLTPSRSLQHSFEREAAEAGGSEREGRDRERDDALSTAPGHKCTESLPPVPSINLTLSESRPLDETATSERSEDYSHSRTVDAVSEAASCTASDLSEIPPSLRLQVNPVPGSSPPLPVTSAPTLSTLRDSSSSPDSGELPPFADTCLSQGSFTLLPPSCFPVQNIIISSSAELHHQMLSSARTIQKYYYKWSASKLVLSERRSFLYLRRSVISLQRAIRHYLAVRKLNYSIMESGLNELIHRILLKSCHSINSDYIRAAITMQSFYRGARTRRELEIEARAATTIQSSYRGYFVRKNMESSLHTIKHRLSDATKSADTCNQLMNKVPKYMDILLNSRSLAQKYDILDNLKTAVYVSEACAIRVRREGLDILYKMVDNHVGSSIMHRMEKAADVLLQLTRWPSISKDIFIYGQSIPIITDLLEKIYFSQPSTLRVLCQLLLAFSRYPDNTATIHKYHHVSTEKLHRVLGILKRKYSKGTRRMLVKAKKDLAQSIHTLESVLIHFRCFV